MSGTSGIVRNGDSYVFVTDIMGPLIVERDNIVIDGASHTLIGSNGRGIVLANRHNVTLKNTCVTLDGGYIIDFADAKNCTLIGNTLIGTPQPIPSLPPPVTPLIGPIGVNLLNSHGITVKDNTIMNFSSALSLAWASDVIIAGNYLVNGILGIELVNATACVFRDNRMINSSFSVVLYPSYLYDNDLDSSNTINGKPIYYWLDVSDAVVPSDAGYVVLVRCRNITVENSRPLGIELISTTNVTISSVKMIEKSDGIDLLDCSNVSILNSILRTHAIGIQIENSQNILIKGNEISNHITRGINLGNANNNLIVDNIFVANSYAIAPSQDSSSNGNIIISNNFTKNDQALIVHGSMTIIGNFFEDNTNAIHLSDSSGNIVTQNTFLRNKNAIYISAASNNHVYLNNFINNTNQVTDAGINSTQTTEQLAKTNSILGNTKLTISGNRKVNFFPPPAPSVNHWDNGSKGNYWSDYTGADANGDGIGDVPHYLYENNRDNYPLMNTVTVSDATISLWKQGKLSSIDSINEITLPVEKPKFQDEMAKFDYGAAAILTLIVGVVLIGAYCLLKCRKPYFSRNQKIIHHSIECK
ncbi:MAG: NosD domain-containing protein [Candidatus Bathyarchaeia archaeon]